MSVGVLAALAVLTGCADDAPTAPSCTYAFTPTSQDVTAGGGSFQLAISTAASCQWSATVDAAWVTLENSRGTGPGTFTFRVAANDGASPRAAALMVQGQGVEIRQEAQPQGSDCGAIVSPSSVSFNASGGAAPLAVGAPSDCRWTATTRDAWISVAGGAGQGNGPMIVSVAPNANAPPRTGSVQVGNASVSVVQAGVGCDFDVSPTSRSIGATGGRFDISITTSGGCDWQAASNDAWLSVSASRGTGSGQVTVTVAATTAGTRTGTLRIAGSTVTVTQSSTPTGCSFVVSPQSQLAPAGGGSYIVNVSTAAGCAWTASSNAPWVTIPLGQSGTGSGVVGLLVAANTSTSTRTAVVQIGAETVTITQAGAPACTYTLTPTTQAVPVTGGRFTVGVAATAGCGWTAASNVTWLTITSGSPGSGQGSVLYSVSANTTGIVRTATVTIGGQALTVTQADK